MIGIYKWTNKINGKVYIGQSVNIAKRKAEHLRLNRLETYNTLLAKAFRKYGAENFEFEVLEECSKDLLNGREAYWIDYYHSTDLQYGYNLEEAGSFTRHQGTHNGRAILNEEIVLAIRNRIYVANEKPLTVYQDYKELISYDAFNKMYKGYTWKEVDCSMIRALEDNKVGQPKAKLTADEVRSIRYRHEVNGETSGSIYKDFSDRVTTKTIRRILNYETWSNITY